LNSVLNLGIWETLQSFFVPKTRLSNISSSRAGYRPKFTKMNFFAQSLVMIHLVDSLDGNAYGVTACAE
jgi:hypothetical protein